MVNPDDRDTPGGLGGRERGIEAREHRSHHREQAAHRREDAAHQREEAAHQREDAAHQREDAAHYREQVVSVREKAAVEHTDGELIVRINELREANENLVAATLHSRSLSEVADHAHRQQERFLAMLAHELRNPLAPIRNAVSVLERVGSNDPRLIQVSSVIARQVAQMARLLDDLLDASRITRGAVTLMRRPVVISEFVEQAIEMCQPQIDHRRQSLTVELPPEPVYVDGDPLRLAQVLGNLLHNASKYTYEEGAIALTGQIEGKIVALYVKDNGCGISASVLPTVFDLFTQDDASLSRSQGGLGIGLAVVRSMVELLDGTVEAHSDGIGQGSEFVVRLPLLLHLPSEGPAVLGQSEPVAAVRSYRVLLVDDNTDSNDMLEILLRIEGHEVTTVADGLTAVARIRDEAPDIVVCDIGLPGLDGYEVAETVRAQGRGEARPTLIAVTGYGQAEDRARALAAGFDHHLVKPIDPGVLIRLIADSRRVRSLSAEPGVD